MSFEQLNLHPVILKAIAESGYSEPTPIQAQAIPEILAGKDVMASAQTGTGKTAAFILPALQHLSVPSAVKSRGPRVLVLTPTRELASQVSSAAEKYGKYLPRFKTVSILGGMPYPLQNKLLSQHIDILVATPGRLIDHIERGRVDFSRLEVLVLDEADRMLDMGFIDDVERIASALPKQRQTLLFSATLDGVIGNVASRLLKEPVRIQVAHAKAKHENIEQRLHYVDDVDHKYKLLQHVLTDIDLTQAIVFTATKRDADTLADDLLAYGHEAASLHGDMTQRERTRTLNNMRNGRIRVLVATDVAARGLDVAGVSHVVNFDLPKFAEDYVHRIGRTGRGGASGIAISFAAPRDSLHVSRIERFTGQQIPRLTIPGLEPKRQPQRSGPKPGGKRFGGKPGFGRTSENRSGQGYNPGRGASQPSNGNRTGNRDGNRDASRSGNRDGNRNGNRSGNGEGRRTYR